MTILELFARIGLKAETGPAEAFQKTMTGLKRDILGAVAGSLSLAGAIKAVNASMGDALEIKKFQSATGASADELQRWRAVADQVSGSGSAVAESIKAIVSNQDKIKLGQGNISGYQLLGIDPRSDPFKVLEEIRAKTANLAPGMKRNVMGMFGVNAELISTLDLTNAQFDRMAKRAYVIPQSSIDGLNRARGSIEMVKNAIMFYTAEMATKLAPTIEKVSQGLVKFFGWIERGVTMFDKLVRTTIGWKTAILGIVAVLGVMNAGFLVSPIGLFTVAMIALLAVMDDFAAYSTGRGSLIGVMLLKFPGLVKVIQPLADALAVILSSLKAIITGDWADFDKMIEKWGVWGDIISGIAHTIANMSNWFPNLMSAKSVPDFFAKMAKGTFLDPNSGAIKDLDQALSKFGVWLDAAREDAKKARDRGGGGLPGLIEGINVASMRGVVAPGMPSNVYNISVTGVDGPERVADAVKRMLQQTQAQAGRSKAEKR